MLLAVDIGNTNIVAGIFENNSLVSSFRISTEKHKTFDEYAALFIDLIEKNNVRLCDINGSVIGCVVPRLVDVFYKTITVYLGVEPLIVSSGVPTGLKILYDNPLEVGADRIANGVAAFDRYAGSSIVVDFGTATTFDCISENAEYMGGVITPGLLISSEALFRKASRLPVVDYVKPLNVIGKNTVESIQSGLIYGYTAMIDGMIEKIMSEMRSETSIISTGGLAPLISEESRYIVDTDEHLTLKGLIKIFQLNE